MINASQARKYCREDITLIKNYEEAVSDTTQMLLCHHRNAEPFTGFCTKDLKKMNMYLQRPASELMFVTRKMHEDIHGSFKKAGKRDKSGSKNSFYGKHWYNNGCVNTFAKSCPEGFVQDRIYNRRSHE